MKLEKIKIYMIVLCMLAAGICYSCKKEEGEAPMTELRFAQSDELLSEKVRSGEEGLEDDLPGAVTGKTGTAKDGSGEKKDPASTQDQKVQEELTLCYVHICGEVKNPGVYELKEGQRVFQAVELAGGLTENAASEFINMAQVVQDGMKLVVPSILEVEGQSIPQQMDDSKPDAKVNINTAAKEQLMTLKGIGESRAEDIIRFREERGNFEKIEDIMKIPGIKDAAFQKIKDDITV